MKDLFTVIGILVIISLLLLSPFATIWSINTLFKTGIEYNFYTWLAMLVLHSGIASTRYSRSKD